MRSISVLLALLLVVACDDDGGRRTPGPGGPGGDDGGGPGGDDGGGGPGGGDGGGDAGGDDGGGVPDVVDAAPDRPEGLAAVWIAVDDRAAGTYQDGQLKWNGSFEWDEASNTAVFNASWLPDERPYPILRDDGPLSEGGHEPEGQTAGDGIHSTVIFVDASAGDVTFEYGVINELDNWIWMGPNGTITLPQGTTESFGAPGLTIEGFGDVDVRITLDAAELDPLVYPEGLPVEDPKVYLKGTLTNWAPVLVRDDGRRGDAEAGDGVYTYQQSERLGAHEGLLSVGQQAQFVWVHLFDPEGDVKELGREYKATAEALPEGVPTFDEPDPERRSAVYASAAGVSAWSRAPGGEWTVEDVGFALESRGATWNTAVEVHPTPGDGVEAGEGEGEGEPAPDPPEGEGEGEPDSGEGEGEGEGDDGGDEGGEVDGGDGGDGGPPPGEGDVEVLLVEPAAGPSGGGTEVLISGRGFADGAVVTFDGADCTGVEVAEGGRSLTCRTPPGDVGPVDVRVQVGEAFGVFRGGFTYREGEAEAVGPDWAALWTPHRVNTVVGLPTPELFCRVYHEGMTEPEGDGGALCEVGFGPDGSHPVADAGDWSWAEMRFAAQQGNDDEYVGVLVSDAPGIFDVAVRVSIDNGRSWVVADTSPAGLGDGYSPDDAGTLTVQPAPDEPALARVEPASGPFGGGGEVTIHGFLLEQAAAARIGGADAEIVEVAAGALTVRLPPGDPGRADVEVDVADDTLRLVGGFRYSGPVVDGHVDDWREAWWVATADVESSWGPGNSLSALGAVSDGERLWVAVRGRTEALNALVGYVDIDAGAGTGVTDFGALADGDGALDVALSGPVTWAADGMGAELGFGTVGMASAQGFNAAAGWRSFDPPNNFPWFEDALVADGEEGVVETSIALPEGAGDEVAIAVRLGNGAGEVLSNQCLPADDPDQPGVVSVVARIAVP